MEGLVSGVKGCRGDDDGCCGDGGGGGVGGGGFDWDSGGCYKNLVP